MATNGDIMRRASILLDDEGNRRHGLHHMREYLNDATREISRRAECLRAKTTAATTADTASITLTQSIVRIHEVYWYDTGNQRYPLNFKPHRAGRSIWGISRDITTSTPQWWWTEGYPGSSSFTLHFWPIPSRDGTAEIHYYRYSSDISLAGTADDTEVDLPSGWQDAAVQWIIKRAREAEQQFDLADRAEREFDNRLAGLVDATSHFTDEPTAMILDDYYDVYGDNWDW